MSACDYLDKEPDDMLTLDKLFNNKIQTEDWLAGVYNSVPDPYHPFMGFMDGEGLDALSDDMAVTPRYRKFGWWVIDKQDGSWTPAGTQAPKYWTVLPTKIRSAQIFIDNVKALPGGVTQAKADNMKNEARFLIAYYYSLMIDFFGPIPFSPDTYLPSSATGDVLLGEQRPFDEIVDWIDKELVELSTILPERYTENEYGRATSIMSLAVRARMLLFAASPLVNGNPAYSDFVNINGEHLFSTAYDTNKWKKAVDACKDLIDAAHAADHKLYYEYKDGEIDPFMSYMNMLFKTERQGNFETLFARPSCETYQHDHYLSPRGYRGAGSVGTPQNLVDAFFMKNGLSPILGYENNNRSKPIINPESGYVEKGFSTVKEFRNVNWKENEGPSKEKGLVTNIGTYNMYCNREARFYISVMWNGEWFRAAGRETRFFLNDIDGGPTHDSPVNGYLVRKKYSPETDIGKRVSAYRPGVLYRLGEAYLNYAEALNEFDPGNPEILKYVNLIRERAGIPKYGNGAGEIPITNDQVTVRQAIRKERRVELNNEGIRYRDIRRWMIGHESLSGNFYGMNFMGTVKSDDEGDDNAFFKRTTYQTRIFDDKMYWYPVPQVEIDRNPNLVQNPGW